MSQIQRRLVSIIKDDTLPDEEKLVVLRQLEADVLSKERSATEGMAASDEVEAEEAETLKAVENAIRKLGHEPVQGGAASL